MIGLVSLVWSLRTVIVHDMYRNSVIYSDVHHQVTRLGLVGSIKATYTGFQFTSTDVHCGTTVMWPSHDTHQGMRYAGKHQRNTSQVGRHRCHTGRLGDDQQQLCA